MAIKTILDKIKAVLGADAPAEVSSLLADAMRDAEDMIDGLAAANKESKSRKEKIRELESSIETLNDQLSKTDPDKQKAEIDRLKDIEGKYNETLKSQEQSLRAKWAEYAKVFSIPETDKRHGIVTGIKDRFKFADADKELDIDAIKANIDAYELLAAAKALDIPAGGGTQPPPQTPNTNYGNEPSKYQSGGQALAAKLAKNK